MFGQDVEALDIATLILRVKHLYSDGQLLMNYGSVLPIKNDSARRESQGATSNSDEGQRLMSAGLTTLESRWKYAHKLCVHGAQAGCHS
jgi:hypothetical protein